MGAPDNAVRADTAQTQAPTYALNRIKFLCWLPDDVACDIDWEPLTAASR